jgi:hypothetical protein
MERLAGSVRQALAGVGVPDAGQLAEITRAWPATVGDPIARAAWPQRISRDGTLHVAVLSSTWAFELGRMAPEILAKLIEALPGSAPSALRFAPGPVPEPPAPLPEQQAHPVASPAPEEVRAGAALAAGATDPELRETIGRAAAASLARARSARRF